MRPSVSAVKSAPKADAMNLTKAEAPPWDAKIAGRDGPGRGEFSPL